TKAGGLSLAEALAAELPVICFGSLPGHEARNEAFAVCAGAALAARSPAELAAVLRRALERPEVSDGLRAAGRALRRPHAAREVADHLLGIAARQASGRALAGYRPRDVQAEALLDIVQDPLVARLVADEQQPQAVVLQDLQRLVRHVRLGVARPRDAEPAEPARDRLRAREVVGEGVVVEEVLAHVREVAARERNLVEH